MATDSAPQDYRPLCPFCAQADGHVCAVKFDGETKTLTFRCDECQRSWAAEEYASSMSSHWSPQRQNERH